MFQKTIKKSVEITGFGLHNGKHVKMKLNPAKSDSGIYFISSKFGDQCRKTGSRGRRKRGENCERCGGNSGVQ